MKISFDFSKENSKERNPDAHWDRYFELPLLPFSVWGLISFWWKPDPWIGFEIDFKKINHWDFTFYLPFFQLSIWRNF